jgi:hypothetical protein
MCFICWVITFLYWPTYIQVLVIQGPYVLNSEGETYNPILIILLW